VRASARVDLQWSEQAAIQEIASGVPDGSALFIGSSRPVRDCEAFVTPRSGLSTFANRGLAGIDGNLSTAFGIATQFERSYSIIGDLTFLHDLSALVNMPSLNHIIFIIDNNGGGIFSTLPQAGVDGFEKVFGTPQNKDLEAILKGFGCSVVKVKNESDIRANFSKSGIHFVIVEVPSREENAEKLKSVTQRVVSAVRMGINLA
ncbi:MAG: 2-succinyl-5-enolpyruvyl-6-hydroxy-3-cyclohexene-carboxylate synthase, partial [Actinomycetota bacterium]